VDLDAQGAGIAFLIKTGSRNWAIAGLADAGGANIRTGMETSAVSEKLPPVAELDSSPRSIQSIYSWYADKKLSVNRRYQRKLVWTLEEKQKLVGSVLNGFPIPAILLAEREDGYEVIDHRDGVRHRRQQGV
jgi:hypothetical protein